MIDRYLPVPHWMHLDHVDVPVTAARAYEACQRFSGPDAIVGRAFAALLSLPEDRAELALSDLPANAAGFSPLAGERGFGFVRGALVQWLDTGIAFTDVQESSFSGFSAPSHLKIAWELRVEPIDAGFGAETSVGWASEEDVAKARSRIVLEIRISGTDDAVLARANGRLGRLKMLSRFLRHEVLQPLATELGSTPEAPHTRHHDTLGDMGEGVLGALGMLANFVTPFLRSRREHWGVDAETASRAYPGDELVPEPKWSWTHGVIIDAPPERVWPWVAQIGQERAGFYSYQFLENLAGCEVQNADTVTTEWTHPKVGDELSLHPKMRLHLAAVDPGRSMVAFATQEAQGFRVSWLFFIEPVAGEGGAGGARTRLISRFRVQYDDSLAARLGYGPAMVEPVGFMMDRRMLLGVKERVENSTLADK